MNAINLYQKYEFENLYHLEKTEMFYQELIYNYNIQKQKKFYKLTCNELENVMIECFLSNNIIFSELYIKYYEKEIDDYNFQERIYEIIEKI